MMRDRRNVVCVGGLAACVLLAVGPTLGEDAFFRIPVADIAAARKVLSERREVPPRSATFWHRQTQFYPYAQIDGGEAYLDFGDPSAGSWDEARLLAGDLLVRAGDAKARSGRMVLPRPDHNGMTIVPFSIPASAARTNASEAFHRAKRRYYEHLLSRDIPGAAWFRHLTRESQSAGKVAPVGELEPGRPGRTGRTYELAATYELFSGGRAMSENLQLDRVLPRAQPNEKPVKLDAIRGITIQEIDWAPLLRGAQPKLDPLAPFIPADQHAVFFPSFEAAVALSDEAKAHDSTLLRAARPWSEDFRVVERYQTQLCLPLSQLARIVASHVVKSVALTGSDPFFPTGTDVAVLFETPQPAVLENLLFARISLDAKSHAEAKPEHGETAGLRYRGMRSPDRGISSYVARFDGAVVVTNSLAQLQCLAEVARGKAKSIASLPEYAFFRNRYQLGDAAETALIFLSDAAIRRWCGPRWRIADSRRTRAAAVLAEVQAAQLDQLVQGRAKAGPIDTDWRLGDAGELSFGPDGAASSVYGSLRFMTPIREIPLENVSRAEADAYEQWRDGYQRNWSWAFDPVALRIGLSKKGVAADLTIMPLIAATQYREMISISQGASLPAGAGDRHDNLIHFMIALNHKSRLFEQANTITAGLARGVSLGWVGRTFEVYVDQDPFWAELSRQATNELEPFFLQNLSRLPVAVRIESSNDLRLAGFLAALRALVEQTAPGLTRWESIAYQDRAYVKITAAGADAAVPAEIRNITLCYAALPDSLTVSLSEAVIRRAIERAALREKAKEKTKMPGAEKSPADGANVALSVDGAILELANHLARDEHQAMMQAACWDNLPILNEWKRRYPQRDPVQVHRLAWQAELVCPGGGKYVWNDRYATMESTVYGHPGEPKRGPAAPPVLGQFRNAEFRLWFEPQGLRAQAVLKRE